MNDFEEVDNEGMPPQEHQFIAFPVRMLLPIAFAAVKTFHNDFSIELGRDRLKNAGFSSTLKFIDLAEVLGQFFRKILR